MSTPTITMQKTREILRLHFDLKLPKRQIARCVKVSHSTVVKYLEKAEQAAITWPLPSDLDDTGLEQLLFGKESVARDTVRPLPAMDELHRELRKKGVTLYLLWQEYKEKYPDGYQYTQFCEHYRRWAETVEVSMRQVHRAGEKLFLDFAGKTIPIINPLTTEVYEAQIFVSVLGASNYTYAEAVLRQDIPSWISCNINALEFIGGVPMIMVPDNLKAAVTRACRYEPELNATYQEFSAHYGTVIIPARAAKPKDKAKGESAVLVVTRWILAALRNRTFFSLRELNEAIRELLERLNNRPFKKLPGCRREMFEAIDKPALRPLPLERYQYAQWKKATVNIDHHIEVEGHCYSVPYQLVRKQVDVRMTMNTVEILFKSRRVALHQRSFQKGGFTTIAEHRPKSHQRYLEWSPSRIIHWAASTVGPHTAELLEQIMLARPHPEQGYRSCLGIMRLGKRYSAERLEAAAQRALLIRSFSYRSVNSILEHGIDQLPITEDKEVTAIVYHDNIRGSDYYN